MRSGWSRRKRPRPARSRFFPLMALAGIVAGAVFALSLCSSDGDDGSSVFHPTPAPSTTALGATETPAPSADGATEAAAAFLSVLAKGRYADMWGMLAPATQQAWGSSDALAAFLERKFGGRKLGFTAGDAKSLTSWRDPETGMTYEGVESIAFGLRADGKDEPEFALAPVVLAREGGGWRVASMGPAGRRGPVFTPPSEVAGTLDVPILVYHHVEPVWPDDFEQRTITVTADAFDAQLAHLRDSGYTSVSVAELANALLHGLPLPEKPVVLTFDDGYDDMFTDAFPLLQEYGFTGTFALVTGYLGNPGYMTWDQVRRMADAGNEMVSHSVSHADLGAVAPEEAAVEVRDSRTAIEANLGRPAQVLIYPYGEPFAHGSEERQQTVLGVLKQEGYAAAVTNPLPGTWPELRQDASRPYQLKRIMVSGGMGIGRFAARLTGDDTQ